MHSTRQDPYFSPSLHTADLSHLAATTDPPTGLQPELRKLADKIAPQRRQPTPPRNIQPGFKVLLGLTLITALLLTPFAFSDGYFELLRQKSVNLQPFLRGEIYKQATGYGALSLVLLETLLTARKRGRGWLVKVKLPGSIMFWRSLHIFLGVGLVGMVLVHTLGANGLNFNAVFLWVFFATTLTALVGILTETGLLESAHSRFGPLPGGLMVPKGPLIRNLRGLWLASHIFCVCVFGVMLGFHIILAYYFQ